MSVTPAIQTKAASGGKRRKSLVELLFEGRAFFALIAIIVVCQAIAEIAVSRNYGVALLFFCPLAIGMSNLSRGAPWPPILLDRVAEAALGVTVAFLTIYVGRRILKVT